MKNADSKKQLPLSPLLFFIVVFIIEVIFKWIGVIHTTIWPGIVLVCFFSTILWVVLMRYFWRKNPRT